MSKIQVQTRNMVAILLAGMLLFLSWIVFEIVMDRVMT